MSTRSKAAAYKRRRNARRKARLKGALQGAAYNCSYLTYHQCSHITNLPEGANYLDKLLEMRMAYDAKRNRPPLSALCVGVNTDVPGKGFDDAYHLHYPNERKIPDIKMNPQGRAMRLRQIQVDVWAHYCK